MSLVLSVRSVRSTIVNNGVSVQNMDHVDELLEALTIEDEAPPITEIEKSLESMHLGYTDNEISLAKTMMENLATRPQSRVLNSKNVVSMSVNIPLFTDIIHPKILAIDVETSGLPTRKGWDVYDDYKLFESYTTSRVVQLGCVLFGQNGEVIEQKEWIVKPQGRFTIPQESADIHGISTERAEAEGIPIEVIIEDFKQLLQRADSIIMHNALFDRHVLSADIHHYGYHDIASYLFNKKWNCTMKMGKDITKIPDRFGRGYKSPSLKELYETLFRESFTGQHTALADAMASGKCFFQIEYLTK